MRTPRSPLPNGIWIYMYLTSEGRERLQKLMDAHGLTQRDLAQAAGWSSHSYLGRLLRGQARTLATEPAMNIARCLGVDVNRLFVAKLSTDTGQTERQGSAA